MLETLPQNRTTIIRDFRVKFVVFNQGPERVWWVSAVSLGDFVTQVFDSRVERRHVLAVVENWLRPVAKETVEESRYIFLGLDLHVSESTHCAGTGDSWYLKIQSKEIFRQQRKQVFVYDLIREGLHLLGQRFRF